MLRVAATSMVSTVVRANGMVAAIMNGKKADDLTCAHARARPSNMLSSASVPAVADQCISLKVSS